ncbi:MAG: hypothetical protein A4E29_01662 [Methanomassiliicoccales archaeon PtaB.Bin134]|nr:MAG: hypothetical protein A4E29_01662 [Methanomassiliicoccales archaeon PtaB.Bin134]
MRIKWRYMAIMVVVMLVISSLTAYVAYESVQRNRLGYIGVEVDKEVFTADEDVTFQLVSLTRNARFNITDRWYMDQEDERNRGFDVLRVPDVMDPETFLDDLSSLDYLRSRSTFFPVGRAFFDHFDSRDGSIRIAWNGTVAEEGWNENGSFLRYSPAVSGHYVIVPRSSWSPDMKVSFMINERSMFYYDSLNIDIEPVNHPDDKLTLGLALRAPPGTAGEISCDLNLSLSYFGSPFELSENVLAFHEETGIILSEGQDWVRTLVFNISIPDHGYVPNGEDDFRNRYFSPLVIDVVLTTAVGTYITGLSAIWDGGWEYEYQY